MDEKFRKRLEILEEAAALANEPVRITSVSFVGVESTVARGRDFECVRLAGEDEATFRARASDECRAAADPRLPQVLIFFGDDEGDDLHGQ
jgi:hypothetical protein